LGKRVTVTIDRPKGSRHPQWDFEYPVNYGFLKGVPVPDGEDLDAYVLKVEEPVEEFVGEVIAIIHRLDDDDDKLVVVPEHQNLFDEEVEQLVEFQERWFEHQIFRVPIR
jgi:inorganic pyrophosphatase